MQPKNFSLPEKFQKARKYEKNEEIMRMSELEKDKTAEFPAFGAKRAFQGVENLTFLDYYTVKEKVKESQSQR